VEVEEEAFAGRKKSSSLCARKLLEVGAGQVGGGVNGFTPAYRHARSSPSTAGRFTPALRRDGWEDLNAVSPAPHVFLHT